VLKKYDSNGEVTMDIFWVGSAPDRQTAGLEKDFLQCQGAV